MKAYHLCHFLLLFMLASFGSFAQNNNYLKIVGTVRDAQSNKKIETTNVSVANTGIGTVTNSDGFFMLKIKKSLNTKSIVVSHIGYKVKQILIAGRDSININVFLEPDIGKIDPVLVVGGDGFNIVAKAVDKIKENYSSADNLLTAFYRETVQKRKSYINVSEAVINVFKTPYYDDIFYDKVKIFKGRKILSPKKSDTLAVKLSGGPNVALNLDFAKNPDFLFDKTMLNIYKYRIIGTVEIDGFTNYVISFTPAIILPIPLYFGKLYVDTNNYTMTRVEANLEMDDLTKVTSFILRKKPAGLKFKPQEVESIVTYKRNGDRSYLNYIKNTIKFKCDWKRKLFSTNYTVIAELVVTDIEKKPTETIKNRDNFNERNSLSDELSNFFDENFWGIYNIIEPSESLENAVNKLLKKNAENKKCEKTTYN